MVNAISHVRTRGGILCVGWTPSRTNNSPLFEVVLKGSRWYVSWYGGGGRERETIDMGLDALQMRRMEQRAKPDGYVSGARAKGEKSMQERLLLSMEARFRRGGQHSLFTRNTYPHFQPDRLSLFRLFQPVLISPLLSRRCQIRNTAFLARSKCRFSRKILPSSYIFNISRA